MKEEKEEHRVWETRFRSEVLSLAFGMLLILLTFGDAHISSFIGNLDTIFGIGAWQLLDVAYPVASIAVFLLYGRAKGGLRISALIIAIFLSYLLALALISLDDIMIVSHLSIILPNEYWIAVEWFYPLYSIFAFLTFGKANQTKTQKKETTLSP
jgi:hypothetical protein